MHLAREHDDWAPYRYQTVNIDRLAVIESFETVLRTLEAVEAGAENENDENDENNENEDHEDEESQHEHSQNEDFQHEYFQEDTEHDEYHYGEDQNDEYHYGEDQDDDDDEYDSDYDSEAAEAAAEAAMEEQWAAECEEQWQQAKLEEAAEKQEFYDDFRAVYNEAVRSPLLDEDDGCFSTQEDEGEDGIDIESDRSTLEHLEISMEAWMEDVGFENPLSWRVMYNMR